MILVNNKDRVIFYLLMLSHIFAKIATKILGTQIIGGCAIGIFNMKGC